MVKMLCLVGLLLLIGAANAYMDRRNEKNRLKDARETNTIKDDPNSDNFLPW